MITARLLSEESSCPYFSVMSCMGLTSQEKRGEKNQGTFKWKYRGTVSSRDDFVLSSVQILCPLPEVWGRETSWWTFRTVCKPYMPRWWDRQVTEAETPSTQLFKGIINIKSLSYTLKAYSVCPCTCSMFFQHLHVHKWTSNEEKICLWICLTLVECNCLLIWVRGKTSLHSAAVDGRLLQCYLYSCLFPHTTPLFKRVRSTYYGAKFFSLCREKCRGKQMALLVGWAPQGCSFYWLTKF